MSIDAGRLANLRSRIERAEDAAAHLNGDIGRMWAERYAGDVAFLLSALAAPPAGVGAEPVPATCGACASLLSLPPNGMECSTHGDPRETPAGTGAEPGGCEMVDCSQPEPHTHQRRCLHEKPGDGSCDNCRTAQGTR